METEEFEIEMPEELEAERQRQIRRRQRIEEMRRQKERTRRIYRCIMAAAAFLLVSLCIGIGAAVRWGISGAAAEENAGTQYVQTPEAAAGKQAGSRRELEERAAQESREAEEETAALAEGEKEQEPPFSPCFTDTTADLGEEIVSSNGVLVDVETGMILAARGADDRINPASMTKILTVLTAADILGIQGDDAEVLDDTFEMTIDITDYSYVNDCSNVGFSVGEKMTVRDLFYGTILPSGADAAVGLAIYTAGSHEAFVELMNEKLAELGLADSAHFENCVGIYGEDHYCTVNDLAVMLKEAADNAFCRQVLSAHTYNTSLTEEHPEGILISNWFLRRIEDRDTHGEVLCGKTGFVNQSGSCAASLALDQAGKEYICVTAGSTSSWQCIDDQTDIFQAFL